MATASESKEDLEAIMLAEVHRLLSEGRGGLRILVTGRTGAGKSALVNSIVGEYVAEEGDSPRGQTTEVIKYEKKVGDIVVTIYDSPGLQDGIKDKNVEDQYLKDLEENCREVDLNLFCVKMNDRMRPSEYDAIIKLSHAFGMEEFWQNTLFVLTFANEIELPKHEKSDSCSLVDHFSKRIKEWKTLLRETLIDKVGITKDVAENVPVVPAGYSDEQSLPAANCDYWLSKLWFQCLDRTEDIAKPILLNINWSRLRPSEEVKKEEIPKKKGFEQPINRDVVKPETLASFFSELSMKDKSKTAAGSGESTTPTPQDQQLQEKLGIPPTLAKLQVLKKGGKKIRIINKVAANWLTLGDLLKIDDLDNIKEEYKNDPRLCCREMFNRWIRGEGVQPSTWGKLIELIDNAGDVVLAKDVKNAVL